MKISTSIDDYSGSHDVFETIKICAEAGFDCLDFPAFVFLKQENNPYTSPGWEEFTRSVKDMADGCGVFFNQAHAPFPSFVEGNDLYNETVWPLILRSFEICKILGVENIILHPFNTEKDRLERNIEFFTALLPYAKAAGVKISIENMFGRDEERRAAPIICSTAEELAALIDALEPGHFNACYDIGHAELIEGIDPVAFVKTLGHDRLKALHIQSAFLDNDAHDLPYIVGKTDWPAVMGALGEIGYDGVFTFEAGNFIRRFPADMHRAAARLMAETGRHLVRLSGL